MNLYVDADACPVRDEIFEVCKRHAIKPIFVANKGIPDVWRNAAALERIDRNALQKLAGATAPVARCVGYDVEWLLPLILSDETTLHGAALVVDDARPL